MAAVNPAQGQYQAAYAALKRAVSGWDRRARVQQSIVWLPRAVMAGLGLSGALAVFNRVQPFLIPASLALITAIMVTAAVLIALAAVWLRDRDPARLAARALRYDLALGLEARVSTALELIEGRIRSNAELTARQLAEAQTWAAGADAKTALPIRIPWRAWLFVLALALVLALLTVLPNPQADALADDAARDAAEQAAIEAARDDLRAITQDIAADPDLEDPARESLLETLDQARQTLEGPDVSPEEAFAALSDVQSELNRQANDLLARSAAAQQALNQAAARLSTAAGASPGAAPQDLGELLNQLADQMAQMPPGQGAGGMASALQQAAQSMMGTNPGLAQQLQQAGDQLGQGNPQGASQSAQQAAQSAEQAQQQAAQQASAGQNAQQQSQQAAQSAQEVAQPNAGESAQQQGDQQSGQQTNSAQPQPAPQSGQQAGSPQGDQNQQSEGEGQSQGQSEGGQPQGSGAQQAQPQPLDAPGGTSPSQGESSASEASAEGAGMGAGDQAANAAQSGGVQGEGVNSGNDPDGSGESDYAPIYAPERIGGQSGADNQLFLEPDSSSVPSVEGNFAENPTGAVTVPYDQVFSDYADAANQALTQNYVPLGLRDVVRNYFSSLEPGRGGR
ncbi:MAG: hypothetical protein SF162_14235 [bacterium]|nr:hypothetical protein [bacterium]